MTTAASLRADSLAVLQGEGYGLPIALSLPSGTPTYDPATGELTPASGDPVIYPGYGRISRFSDALAASSLLDNADNLIIWIPADPTVEPVNDGTLSVSLADGTTKVFTIVSWTPRYLGNDVIHYRVQGRR